MRVHASPVGSESETFIALLLHIPLNMPSRTCRHARPPACTMLDAPLKQVVIMRFQSACTLPPSVNFSFFGTTVQPRRTPVKPAYLLKLQVSMATSSAPAERQVRPSGEVKPSRRMVGIPAPPLPPTNSCEVD